MAIDWNEIARRIAAEKYEQILGRKPDKASLDFWAGTLMSGQYDSDSIRRAIAAAAGLPDPGIDFVEVGRRINAEVMQDPVYAAFLREQGFQDSQIESQLAATKDRIERQRNLQAPMFEDQKKQAEQASNASFENRGLFRSGARLKEINEKQAQVERQRQMFEAGLTEEQIAAEQEAARKRAELGRQKTEQETAARQRLTTRAHERAMNAAGFDAGGNPF